MNLKRRQLLTLGGLSGFGLALLGKGLQETTRPGHSLSSSGLEGIVTARTDSKDDLLLRFVSLADTGTGAEGQYAVAEAMARYRRQKPFSLAILAGDNIYNDGEIEKIGAVFEQPYQPLLQQGVRFQACLGNHDIRTANGNPQIKYPGFNMGGRYYTFRRGPVQFFALDTNFNAPWKTQLAWLEQELKRSDVPWKIVFGHHPIYSSGHYGVSRDLLQNVAPLFQKYQVQLYLNGHDHDYERTRPINGTTYLTCGAGAGTRPVGRSAWTKYSAEKLSFAAFEVYRNRLVIRGIGTDSQAFDQDTIQLQPARSLVSAVGI